jgi:hypothetical protein
MSNDTSNTPKSGELFGGDAAGIRAYRFEFRHALVLPAVVILFVAVASGMLSFARFSVEIFGPIRWIDRVRGSAAGTAPAGARFQRGPDRSSDSWARYERKLRRRRTRTGDAASPSRERALTEVFAAVDRSDPRQMRKFLAAYKNDPVAQELGYIDAVQRAVSERRLFRSDEIVACDQCWCLREGPASVNEGQTTQ